MTFLVIEHVNGQTVHYLNSFSRSSQYHKDLFDVHVFINTFLSYIIFSTCLVHKGHWLSGCHTSSTTSLTTL